ERTANGTPPAASCLRARIPASSLRPIYSPFGNRRLWPQKENRSESCKLRSPPPTPPPLVSTFPKVARFVGLRPILVVPLQPLPPHQFGWLMKLYASARNCSPVFSVIGKDLNNPRFQFWNPGW